MRTLRGNDPLALLRRGQSGRLRRSRRKKSKRRTLIVVLGLWCVGVMFGALYAGRHYVTHASRFALREIVITPTMHASREELNRAVNRHIGRNLFRLDLGAIERDMQEVRWVRRAIAKRLVPGTLHCSIEERVPRGLALLDGEVWLVDAGGTAIDVYGEKTLMYSFPIFTGVAAEESGRRREQIARGVRLLEFLEDRDPEMLAQISEIDLARDDRISLRMNQGGPEIRLHPERFGFNLDRFLAMREFLATHLGDGAYVDLRFRDSIAFQPAISGRRQP